MDYSKMSDFEINKLVAEQVGGFIEEDIFDKEQTIFKHHGNSKYSKFDPCNSWADAGPIIEKHGIGLMPFKKTPAKAWPLSVGLLSNASVEHENPLRAAMVVFLMMHDKGEE